jgi:hypothetical protein
MARAARGDLDGVEIEDGALYIARMKATVPEAERATWRSGSTACCRGCASPSS